jgi:cellulose biosynthesis protein BcsQ
MLNDRVCSFVSSTFLDLRDHRQRVISRLDDLGWATVRCMERQAAGEDCNLLWIKMALEESHVYVGMIGNRYGTPIKPGAKKSLSFTHWEYRKAGKLHLYRIVLLELNFESEDERLIRFREEVKKKHTVSYFANRDDASAAVLAALGSKIFAMRGDMIVETIRPLSYFLLNVKRKVDLRKAIARDSGVPAHDVWLTNWYARDEEHALHHIMLPPAAMKKYLELRNRAGGVTGAWSLVDFLYAPTAAAPRVSGMPSPLGTGHVDTWTIPVYETTYSFFSFGYYEAIFGRELVLRDVGMKPLDRITLSVSESEFIVLGSWTFSSSGFVALITDVAAALSLPVVLAEEAGEDMARLALDLCGEAILSVSKFLSRETLKTNGEGDSIMHMQGDNHIIVEGRLVPVIAFFGTKGGVGKTTIVDKFSTLVARGSHGPKVLMVDFDVHHRGLTVLRTLDRNEKCLTVHQYLADESLTFERAFDVTKTDYSGQRGKEYLIPSSDLAAEKVYQNVSHLDPDAIVRRITELLRAASAKYQIDLILVDCGPIVDPLTASAAFMSDKAFIIGQNEPITFQSLQNYAMKIRDFFPGFESAKVRVILNKVRGRIIHHAAIFATIPFTMEVVDYSEGLENIDEIRLAYLDSCVREIISSVFRQQNSELIPGHETVLTPSQKEVIDRIANYSETKWYRRLKRLAPLFFAGCCAVLLSIVLYLLGRESGELAQSTVLTKTLPLILLALGALAGGIGGVSFWNLRRANGIMRLWERFGYEGILKLLPTKKGRQKFDLMAKLSARV